MTLKKGLTIFCANGHPIFDLAEDIEPGKMMDAYDQSTTNWRQERPKVGGQFPVCVKCGAALAAPK